MTAGLPSRVAAWYAAVFLCSVVAYGALWSSAPLRDGDSDQYLEVARDLADGRLDVLHVRSPGYPLLLTITGSGESATRALFYISLSLHFASVWLLGMVLCASGVRSSRLIAFGLLMTLPPYVEPAGYVMTENLAQFMLAAGAAGLLGWFRNQRLLLLVLGSLAFGYAGITRPVYQVLPVALAGGVLLAGWAAREIFPSGRSIFLSAVGLIGGFLIIVGGLSLYNWSTFGYAGVSPTLGFHLTTKTVRFVERLPDEYSTVRTVLLRVRDEELTRPGGRHDGTQTIWTAREELERVTGLDTPGLSAYLVKMNLALISRAPIEYLEDVARSLGSYWLPASGMLATFRSSILRWLWGVLHLTVVATFFAQAAALPAVTYFTSRPGPRRRGGLLPAETGTSFISLAYLVGGAIVAYTMVLSCFLDIGEPRQRRPTDALIVMMCFLGARAWKTLVSKDRLTTDAAGRA
jgi:hypothetical protein